MKLFFLLLALALVIALVRPLRERLLEEIKELSDRAILLILAKTSGFERELTPTGRSEQALWREQRLRNLRGLALRSRQRYQKSATDGSERS
ncbi:MAG TPA: hypothetical protein VNL14_08035 [Candidatus Acidoferrales bacterium]|nr:hypothetical protein [Candidatus Acidoferrales bacterium]